MPGDAKGRELTPSCRAALRPRRDIPSIVDHLLDGPVWPDDVVDAINDRSRDGGRDVLF